MRPRLGDMVMLKSGNIRKLYSISNIEGSTAHCVDASNSPFTFPLVDLVKVARFGEPIYPTLRHLDSINTAPQSNLWHTLIEADNYHALQLLEYLYPEKVDCIYIDPPYNSGAKDWKYNNDYVDGNDVYRHSKWLSMMEKRLKIAKRLLNPANSVLIVTIDEKEYLRLGCMLEQIFPTSRIQMISTVINPKGVARGGFRRCDEYIFFVMNGTSVPCRLELSNEWSPSALKAYSEPKEQPEEPKTITLKPDWTSMMRRGSNSQRSHSPGAFYAIYVDPHTKTIVKVGAPLPVGTHRDIDIPGLVQTLPLRTNQSEGCWQCAPTEFKKRVKQGRVKVGSLRPYGYVINYLPDGAYNKILNEGFIIEGFAEDGSILASKQVSSDDADAMIAPTQWKIASHNASEYGTTLLRNIFIDRAFTYPKSLYAVQDTLRFFVANNPNALIVDFFAGSGTTLHAVNLLNAADNGNRRCIMITNNEVGEDEAKRLTAKGLYPGDEDWEKFGIAKYVTWPRTICSIKGIDVNGNPLKNSYIGTSRSMAEGFAANCEFFKLEFLDKTSVALGRQFKEILPLLWLRAGAIGPRPTITDSEIPDMLVKPENNLAVLTNVNLFADFRTELECHPDIQYVFIVTDSTPGFQEMSRELQAENVIQLYRDYLDNFRINAKR